MYFSLHDHSHEEDSILENQKIAHEESEITNRVQDHELLLPYYAIQRGESTIMISMNTGVVVNLILSENDKKPFDFLKKEITGYMKGVNVYE